MSSPHELLAWSALDLLDDEEQLAWEEAREETPLLGLERERFEEALDEAGHLEPAEADLDPALWERVAAAVAEPEAPAAEVELTLGVRCSYCHDGLVRSEAGYCASCLAPHHADCFLEHGRCSVAGCEETSLVRARDAAELSPLPLSRGALQKAGWAALALLVGVVGVAALALELGAWEERQAAQRAAELGRERDRLLAQVRPATPSLPRSAPRPEATERWLLTDASRDPGPILRGLCSIWRIASDTPLVKPAERLRRTRTLVIQTPIPEELLRSLPLEEFLHEGGGLVLLGDQPVSDSLTLRRLSPVIDAELARSQPTARWPRVELRSKGHPSVPLLNALSHQADELPGLRAGVRPGVVRPGAELIAVDRTGWPLLATWQIGRGRAVYLGARAPLGLWSESLGRRDRERLWADLLDWSGSGRRAPEPAQDVTGIVVPDDEGIYWTQAPGLEVGQELQLLRGHKPLGRMRVVQLWRGRAQLVPLTLVGEVEPLHGDTVVSGGIPEQTVSLSLQGAPLNEALEALAREAGRAVHLAAPVVARIDYRCVDLPWSTALADLARLSGCVVESRPHGRVLRPLTSVELPSTSGLSVAALARMLGGHGCVRVEVSPELAGFVLPPGDDFGARVTWRAGLNRLALWAGGELVRLGPGQLGLRAVDGSEWLGGLEFRRGERNLIAATREAKAPILVVRWPEDPALRAKLDEVLMDLRPRIDSLTRIVILRAGKPETDLCQAVFGPELPTLGVAVLRPTGQAVDVAGWASPAESVRDQLKDRLHAMLERLDGR